MSYKNILLSIDSSSLNQSFTVIDKNDFSLLFEKNSEGKSSELLSSIIESFENLNLKAMNIKTILCSRGPGSFTGIRTALSIVNLFKHQLNLEAFTVNNFELIRFEQNLSNSDPIKISAGKKDFFISLNSDYENLNNNFFVSEAEHNSNKKIRSIELKAIKHSSSSMLIFEFFKDKINTKDFSTSRDSNSSLCPYYLREASLGKLKKLKKSIGIENYSH